MLTFPDPRITKAAFVDQLQQHRAADRIAHVGYWSGNNEKGRGCAVGCSLNSIAILTKSPKLSHGDHALYEPYIGVPKTLARLEDRIFEGSSLEFSLDWPVRFGQAIPEARDLSMVWPRFVQWLLDVEVRQFAKSPKSIASLDQVLGLYREWIDVGKPDRGRWIEASIAAAAATDAYAYAADAYAADAYAAAYAYDADAAADAADAAYAAAAYAAAAYAAAYAAAAYAAADAADAAAAYAAADAAAAYARSKSYERQGEKLLELMAAA